MSSRPLLRIVAVCLVLLAAGNILLSRWSRSLPSHRAIDNLQRAPDSDLLFVGNSLLDGRVDSAALNQGAASAGRTFRPLNAALSATDPHDQAFLARYALWTQPHLHTLVVGFYDYQLTEETRVTPADLLGNHGIALDERFPVGVVASIDHFSTAQTGELLLLRALPMAANRVSFWKYAERLRYSMSRMGMPPEPPITMIRPWSYYNGEPRKFLEDPSHFNSSYEYLFGQAAKERMKVVLVLMPMSPLHSKVFYTRQLWQDYMVKLRDLAQQRGFTFVDASAWMPEDVQFEDALHMTKPAATTFSFRLGAELAAAQGSAKAGN